jgi:hypothetical protein
MYYRYRICPAADAPDSVIFERVIEAGGRSEHEIREEAITRATEYERTHGRVTVLLRGEEGPVRAGGWQQIYASDTSLD